MQLNTSSVSGTVKGMSSLRNRLRSLSKQARRGPTKASVIVSFNTPYAIYVHENLEAVHPVGEAKFLENAYRQYDHRAVAIVTKKIVKEKKTMLQALKELAELVKVEAQKRCPVDTGRLKASAKVQTKY